MTNTIDAIADLINAVGMNGTTNEDAAEAILETLKARIPDLVWDKHPDEDEYYGGGQDETTGEAPYFIGQGSVYGAFYVEFNGHQLCDDTGDVIWHDTPEEAKAAANAHNKSQALKLMGWDV